MAEARFELSVERRIAAPVERVWHVMTARLEEWFCPAPWRAEARTLEWHAGGRSLIVMHGPNGEEMPNEGIVLAVEPNRRLVMTDAFTGDWQPAGPFMVGLFEIEPDGDGTLYRGTARHWTREAMEQHRAMGFEKGWGTAADQLKALAEHA
ncbi:SRPBCC domain-containing protein [Sphingomonas pseudosanguinis]|uniref:SRPBCC domain-containing protein n=1 Tax=Sphingomonas pseudosanguinis TaxID=413712 RepID=UPI003F82CCEB